MIDPEGSAIDVHVHAEVSCHDPEDPVMSKFFDAASSYFKVPRNVPRSLKSSRITVSKTWPSVFSP